MTTPEVEMPPSKRQLTRSALLRAARTVFEEDGFLDARITDISERAGFAHGTFYTYFSSKEEIFLELALQLQQTMISGEESDHASDESLDPMKRIERANRSYLEGYAANAKFMGIVEQVSMFNDELRIVRQARVDQFCARATRQIERLQAAGLADPTIDPAHTAIALTSMVSRFAYVWLVEAKIDLETHIDPEESVRTLTSIWARAIGVDPSMVAAEPRPTNLHEAD